MNSKHNSPIVWIIIAVGATVVIVFTSVYAWLIYLESVEESYSTRDGAVEARLFERGWLPDIIPESARRIEIVNNLDINTSTGSFEFDLNDLDDFVRDIQDTNKDDSRRMGSLQRMEELSDEGYMSFYYSNGGTLWRFFIHPSEGRCEYWADAN